MTKGKPWPADDEKRLRDWFELGVKDYVVLSFNVEGRYSQNAIYQKLLDLGLLSKEDGLGNFSSSSSCSPAALELPDELPSIEDHIYNFVIFSLNIFLKSFLVRDSKNSSRLIDKTISRERLAAI
jgi:hypothetical protein